MHFFQTERGRTLCRILSRVCSLVALTGVTLAMLGYVSVNLHVFTVVDNGQTETVAVLSGEPSEALAAAGVSLAEGDRYNTAQNDSGYRIDIERAYNVRVTVDGSTKLVRMTGGTVSDALELAGVEVNQYDQTNVKETTPVSEGLDICVERVKYEEYTVSKTVAYETEIKYTNTLAKGKKKTIQQGKNGKTVYTYRKRIVDGEVVDTELVSKEVVTQPVNRVRLVGTVLGTAMSPCPFDIELDEGGQPVNYKEVFTGKATAYTAKKGARTSTGRLAQVGVVAVDPRKIPYGSKLYIVSADGSYVYGYAIAGDTGGSCRAGRIVADLYMDTKAECFQFGRRKMKVYVLE